MKKATGEKLRFCNEVDHAFKAFRIGVNKGRYTYYIRTMEDGTKLLYQHNKKNQYRIHDRLIAYRESHWSSEWMLPDY